MIRIRCKYEYLLYPKVNTTDPFRIVKYLALDDIKTPDGKTLKRFSAKGEFLPITSSVNIILKGKWEEYKDKKTKEFKGYTFKVEDFEEEVPTEEASVIRYLSHFDGIGPKTARKMYKMFGNDIFDIILNEHTKLAEIKGISLSKAEKIKASYLKNSAGRELYTFMYKYNVPNSVINRIWDHFNVDALEIIKTNAYRLAEINGIGYNTANDIAKSMPNYETICFSDEKIAAAIMEVLAECENGGFVFTSRAKLPDFVNYNFLPPTLFKLANGTQEIFSVTGNTCLSIEILYLQLLKLLNKPEDKEFRLTYDKFIEVLNSMYYKSLIHNLKLGDQISSYRKCTANAEFHISKKIKQMLLQKKHSVDNLIEHISNTENKLEMLLSEEQRKAVYNSITEPLSIITGGPGTGKTAVQRVLLATYEYLYPEGKTIVLAAPTGMAAKKMSESTGKPARTIHSLLGLRAGEDFEKTSTKPIEADLMIVDEASMVDTFLMSALLKRIPNRCQLIIVGDVDQLPSVGCGCVLKELIDANVIPTVRLTNIFRQGPGSSITVNAARIKTGETTMMYSDDFIFINRPNTQEILKEVKKLYSKEVKEKGLENVTVLSAYRRSTDTGVDKLNPVLRDICADLNDSIPHYTNNGVTFYLGDKVMFTKNSGELINGDIGYIKNIIGYGKNVTVVIDFSDNIVELEDEDLDSVVLAYATTVHKSQGSEYHTVIMIVDPAHEKLLKRNLLYTGITRAKKQIYIIGEQNAFINGILAKDSEKRKSNLAQLLGRNQNNTRRKMQIDNSINNFKQVSLSF